MSRPTRVERRLAPAAPTEAPARRARQAPPPESPERRAPPAASPRVDERPERCARQPAPPESLERGAHQAAQPHLDDRAERCARQPAPPESHARRVPQAASPQLDERPGRRAAETVPPRRPLTFEERVALFVGTIHRARADELLAGLTDAQRLRAGVFVGQLQQGDSAQRQARLAHEFGVRTDAEARLQQLVLETDGALRGAVVASLPPATRLQFPQLAGGPSASLATRALAARLVREASRESTR